MTCIGTQGHRDLGSRRWRPRTPSGLHRREGVRTPVQGGLALRRSRPSTPLGGCRAWGM